MPPGSRPQRKPPRRSRASESPHDEASVAGRWVDDVHERLAGRISAKVVGEQLDAAIEDTGARPRRVGSDDDVRQIVERRRWLERLVAERVEDRAADRAVAEGAEERPLVNQ